MKLRHEYQAIVDATKAIHHMDTAHFVAERCQELADRPPVMLTGDEINDAYNSDHRRSHTDRCRDVIAAFIAKQKEPRKIKCRLYWDDCGNLCVWMFHNKTDHTRIEKWYGEVFEVEA